jgi:predicted AlkP superfamily phosphohydrolase/phosphomutase
MDRTLLLGLDGATFDVLDPYVDRGIMPFLGSLLARGARARLDSIVPALTPPAWTSLMTGKRPGRHGVFDFFQKEEPGGIHFRFASSQDVQSPTIWSLAGDAGRRVTSVNFPLMFPAPPVNGCVVPGGMMPWRQLRLGCHPPGLFDRLKALPGFNAREMLDMQLEVKAVEGCPDDEYAEYVELHITREQRWFDVARHLMREEPAELVGVLFDGVDKLQHLCWRFIDPACRPARPSGWEAAMIERCERYFRTLDGILADLVELAGPDATVVVASDHGFGATEDVFHVNTWLERRGLLAWADEQAEDRGDGTHMGFAEVTRHVHAVDWSRTLAYAATPSSQGINIVDRVPGGDEPLPADVRARVRAEIAVGLLEVRRPRDGRPLVAQVWTREEAFQGPHAEIGPDLSLLLADAGTVSILPSEAVVARRPQLRGHHRTDGVLIAAGPGIRAGVEVGARSIVDVAPLVLHRLGLAVPDDMDGEVPVDLLEPDELRARPPRSAHAAGPGIVRAAPPAELELDPEEQAGVIDRLRALGYVE